MQCCGPNTPRAVCCVFGVWRVKWQWGRVRGTRGRVREVEYRVLHPRPPPPHSRGTFSPPQPLPQPRRRRSRPHPRPPFAAARNVWCLLLFSRQTVAIYVAHFTSAWGWFIILSWLPKYLASLNVDISKVFGGAWDWGRPCDAVWGQGGGTTPSTPTLGPRQCEPDTSGITGPSGRQNTVPRRNMQREDRVTVQGPVKRQQPDGMSDGGGGGGLRCACAWRGRSGGRPPPPPRPPRGPA